ncbi:unnamed protein product, partial [Ceratitis capitata]
LSKDTQNLALKINKVSINKIGNLMITNMPIYKILKILTGRITVITTLKTCYRNNNSENSNRQNYRNNNFENFNRQNYRSNNSENFNRQNYRNNNHQNYPNTTQQSHNYQIRYGSSRQLNPAQKEFTQQNPRYPSPEPMDINKYDLVGKLMYNPSPQLENVQGESFQRNKVPDVDRHENFHYTASENFHI